MKTFFSILAILFFTIPANGSFYKPINNSDSNQIALDTIQLKSISNPMQKKLIEKPKSNGFDALSKISLGITILYFSLGIIFEFTKEDSFFGRETLTFFSFLMSAIFGAFSVLFKEISRVKNIRKKTKSKSKN
jgi:hypothetical protein